MRSVWDRRSHYLTTRHSVWISYGKLHKVEFICYIHTIGVRATVRTYHALEQLSLRISLFMNKLVCPLGK